MSKLISDIPNQLSHITSCQSSGDDPYLCRMPTEIKCPSCGTQFPLEQSIRQEVEAEWRGKWVIAQKKKDEETRSNEQKLNNEINQLQKIVANQEDIMRAAVEKATREKENDIRKKLLEENDVTMRFLNEKVRDAESKVKKLKDKELEALELHNALQEMKRNAETEKRKYLLENADKLIQDALLKEKEGFDLERTALEIKIEQQRKQVDEMKKKLEQGSTQLQGEAQEILLEEILQQAFPFDKVGEVPKGKKGADCLLLIHDRFGNESGKILFESKRTSGWGKDWVEKLKYDMISSGADTGVLVSKTLPDACDGYEYQDGIWICGFKDVKILTASIREGLLRVHSLHRSREGKGDKVQMLYDYMTSPEFAAQWKNIRHVFRNMQDSIRIEREMMEKLWKNREKQLERALLNSNQVMGAIEGISGKNSIDMSLLEDITERE